MENTTSLSKAFYCIKSSKNIFINNKTEWQLQRIMIKLQLLKEVSLANCKVSSSEIASKMSLQCQYEY